MTRMKVNQMSLLEHIAELRKRLLIVALAFVVFFIAGFFLAKPIIVYLQETDEAKQLTLNAFNLTDPLYVFMQFAFIIGIVLTSPVILYQLWAFVSPGLYEKERKVTLSYIPVSILLFLAGLSFSYYILFPFVVDFMKRISQDLNVNQVIGINEYFHFLLQLTIPFGLLFQMPVILMFLTRLGIVTPMFLAKIRKYAYFTLLVIAALITPPELLSHMMVTVPLLILYEISILISKAAYRKAQKSSAADRDVSSGQ
ncbi:MULTISPECIES: twin-arginine translocase subunit TatC [Bacillaceae]|uniref:Sec-independent protein translocase protein TatCy n=3 Tax=Bacillus subtilis subsp. subtilis TaxID=135461 RepID=TATCY_BACSU|nr:MULTISPECIES: twin-arginine translocase subunit TatC [Bacillales]NP_388480.1 component of the twin-arginine pre-protein translocation pathway [Bacillus subtilis subsp. subtilis str. 168]O05523.1 RecName: Full=Sec-independent protein translocase protein TatCy [Bacillus subtilis subsp. subtilis str. 168]MBU8845236.1 twin-arginine translocase subunit TatC [Alkalicoccobacillus gibsonii]AFQ56518.1 Component of the twin-arginine pre-proteintranslocation [Bacillus subtilis QB928]AGG59953.1 compone